MRPFCLLFHKYNTDSILPASSSSFQHFRAGASFFGPPDLSHKRQPTLAACVAHCQSTPNCHGVSFDRHLIDVKGETNGMCWLKSGLASTDVLIPSKLVSTQASLSDLGARPRILPDSTRVSFGGGRGEMGILVEGGVRILINKVRILISGVQQHRLRRTLVQLSSA